MLVRHTQKNSPKSICEDHWSNDQHHGDARPISRDAELKKHRSGETCELTLQELYLREPRIALRRKHCEAAVPTELPQDLVRSSG